MDIDSQGRELKQWERKMFEGFVVPGWMKTDGEYAQTKSSREFSGRHILLLSLKEKQNQVDRSYVVNNDSRAVKKVFNGNQWEKKNRETLKKMDR